MDIRIAGYCNKRDITYTRYADDLIFSCDNRDMLRKIYGMIKKIVEDEGFVVIRIMKKLEDISHILIH